METDGQTRTGGDGQPAKLWANNDIGNGAGYDALQQATQDHAKFIQSKGCADAAPRAAAKREELRHRRRTILHALGQKARRLSPAIGPSLHQIDAGVDMAAGGKLGSGHRVPTGDPFRRLQLQLLSNEQATVPLSTYSFGRRFRNPPNGDKDTWILIQDLSIPPPTQDGTAVRSFTAPALGAKYFRLLFSYPAPSSRPDLQNDDVAVEVLRGAVPQQTSAMPPSPALPPKPFAPSQN